MRTAYAKETVFRGVVMTDKKICPVMSRPRQGDRIVKFHGFPEFLFSSEDKMKEYGYFVIDGLPFSDMIPCIYETCMAWEPPVYRCQLAWLDKCQDADGDDCDMDTCTKCVKVVHTEGFCKLIDGDC